MPIRKSSVPRGTTNPISYLLGNGWSEAQLALAWGRTVSTIQKLRGFRHVPDYKTALLMAKTFAWDSAGQVMDFWHVRVVAREEAEAAAPRKKAAAR